MSAFSVPQARRSVSSVNPVLASLPLTGRANVDGFIGGGQAGYNWQRGTWVFGLEGDIQYSDERGRSLTSVSSPDAPARHGHVHRQTTSSTGLAPRAAVIGFLPTERVLLVRDRRSGLSAHLNVQRTGGRRLSWGSTRAGWTVGAGVEAAIDQQLVGQARISLHGSRRRRQRRCVGHNRREPAEYSALGFNTVTTTT